MRRLFRTLCAAALVACADSHAPTAALAPHLAPSGPRRDTLHAATASFDPRSIPERLTALVGDGFGKVSLPPDSLSRSSDAVHPDLACLDAAWNGARCWMMYTPYKNGDASFENPGFLIADNDTSWTTPPAIVNPIVKWPGQGSYNSDPDHAFDPGTRRLTQVYRVVSDSFNKIMIMSTADARTWTTAHVAFQEKNHDAISPALVIDADRSATIWYVRSGTEGCNSTSSSVVLRTATPTASQRVDQATWSNAVAVKLSIPNYIVWHIDVATVSPEEGYVALVVAYPKGTSCGSSDLWLATSQDGITWRTFAVPLMWRSMTVAKTRKISTWYRGTLRYDAQTDSLHVWPSGLAGSAWTIYHAAFKLHDALGLLASAQPSDFKALATAELGIRATIPMP